VAKCYLVVIGDLISNCGLIAIGDWVTYGHIIVVGYLMIKRHLIAVGDRDYRLPLPSVARAGPQTGPACRLVRSSVDCPGIGLLVDGSVVIVP
jgi:hypothetical protein